jgi:CheY-like chemotaxis protein
MRAVRAYEDSGHPNRLLVARTAEHAMTLLKACGRGLRFGLVMVDLYAPLFGGADLIRRIRKDPELRETPIVVLAPEHETDDFICEAASQANTWVRRPTSHAAFCRLIDKVMHAFLGLKSKGTCQETK